MKSPPPAPRPNRQRERTRKALLLAGQSLFAARAVDSVTIDEIVEAADVGKGSFYNHFEDKDALAKAIYDTVQDDIEDRISHANTGIADAPRRIARAMCVVMRYALDHPDRLQAMLSLAERRTGPRSPLNAGITRDIEAGLDQKRLAGINAETGVLTVLGLTTIGVRHALSDDVEASPAALTADLAAAVLRALGLPAAEAAELGREAAGAII